MKCPACGAKVKELKGQENIPRDRFGEYMNARNVYRCVQCATTILVPF
jgi:uncharacterized protein with PIN domain